MICVSRHLLLTALCGALISLVACSSGGDGPVAESVGQGVPPPTLDTTAVLDAPPVGSSTTLKADLDSSVSSTNLTVDQRLARLETDIAGVKSQMTLVRPILEKMPALQDKLGELVNELQRIDARVAAAQAHVENLPAVSSAVDSAPVQAPFKPTKMAPIVEPAPKPAVPQATKAVVEPQKKPAPAPVTTVAQPQVQAQPPVKAPMPAALETSPTVSTLQHIRVGDDEDKTRVVLDITRKSNFTYDLDNTEKVLVVEVDVADIQAVKTATLEKSPLIAGYTADVTAGKARVVLQLRVPVKVLSTSTLPPNGDKGDRVVIDLVPMT